MHTNEVCDNQPRRITHLVKFCINTTTFYNNKLMSKLFGSYLLVIIRFFVRLSTGNFVYDNGHMMFYETTITTNRHVTDPNQSNLVNAVGHGIMEKRCHITTGIHCIIS